MTFKKLTPIAVAFSVLIATLIPTTSVQAADYYQFETGAFTLTSAPFVVENAAYNNVDSDYGSYISYPIDTEMLKLVNIGSSYIFDYNKVYGFMAYLNNPTSSVVSIITEDGWKASLNGTLSYFIIYNGERYELGRGAYDSWINLSIDSAYSDYFYFGVRFVGSIDGMTSGTAKFKTAKLVWSCDNMEYQFVDYGYTQEYQINSKMDTTNTWLDRMHTVLGWINDNVVHWGTYINGALQEIKSQMATWQEALEYRLTEIQSVISDRFDALFSKMDEEHDEITNGYDDSSGTETNNKLNDSLTQIDDSQASIVEDGVSSLDDYTIPEQGIISYGTAFTAAFGFVATFMQAIFESAGNLTIITSVSCTLLIVAMIVGLHKFYKG